MKNTHRYLSIGILIPVFLLTIACLGSAPRAVNPGESSDSEENLPPSAEQTTESSVFDDSPLPTPTVYGVTEPQGILAAGTPVIIDDYWMVVDPSGLTVDDDFIGFSIQLRVLGDQQRLFRYNASALRLRDDLGNSYDYYYNISGTKCTESDIYLAKQIMVEPDEDLIIEPHTSMMYSSYFWWCLDDQNQDIPGFIGNIPAEASKLILEFDGFGPFSAFGYEFDL